MKRSEIFSSPLLVEVVGTEMDYFNSVFATTGSNSILEVEAIKVLSDRLLNSTHSSDRRSAILGIKSFSRLYRETVVESGLRAILNTLTLDSNSFATVKAVLETLLILVLKSENSDKTLGWISSKSRVVNGKYPSPLLLDEIEPDQLSLWIADELTSTDAYFKLIIDILSGEQDFFIELYSLQLLEALLLIRPNEVKELITNIPVAISTITILLENAHDQIRNETIILLMALVKDNYNAQKLVVFENTFDRIFDIMEEEGGIRGSLIVQDCLSLCKNLLRYNASNQEYFLETSSIQRYSQFLSEPIQIGVDGQPAIFWTEQRLSNMVLMLDICRIFVFDNSLTIRRNQTRLEEIGILDTILRIAFHPDMDIELRCAALRLAGDAISSNFHNQKKVWSLDVPNLDPSLPSNLQNLEEVVPVSQVLLQWALQLNSVHFFDVRIASAYCLLACFKDNSELCLTFLRQQISACSDLFLVDNSEGLPSSDDSTENQSVDDSDSANIFSSLIHMYPEKALNPYKLWLSSYILMEFLIDCPEGKELVERTQIGRAENGEEVMPFDQAMANIMVTVLESPDPRISIGYLSFLSLWLFEDLNAVNRFLEDRSIIDSLLRYLCKNSIDAPAIVHGMGALLVGICYEFSSKSSPINRYDLHDLIAKVLGPENYLSKLQKLKEEHINSTDFDIQANDFGRDNTGLPMLFFMPPYLRFFKENYGRLKYAMLHDPSEEPILRIDHDAFEKIREMNTKMFKELENNKSTNSKNIENLQQSNHQLTQKLEKLEFEITQTRDTNELLQSNKMKLQESINSLEKEGNQLKKEKSELELSLRTTEKQFSSTQSENDSLKLKLANMESKHKNLLHAKDEAESGINKMNRELMKMDKEKKDLEDELKKFKKDAEKDASKLQERIKSLLKKSEAYERDLKKTNEDKQALELQLKELHEKERKFVEKIHNLEKNSQTGEAQINDLKAQLSKQEENEKLLKDNYEATKSKLKETQNEVENYLVKIRDLQKEKNELQSQSELMSKELSVARTSLEITKSKLTRSEEEKKRDFEKLNIDIESYQKKIKERDIKISSLISNNEELSQNNKKLRDEKDQESPIFEIMKEDSQKEIQTKKKMSSLFNILQSISTDSCNNLYTKLGESLSRAQIEQLEILFHDLKASEHHLDEKKLDGQSDDLHIQRELKNGKSVDEADLLEKEIAEKNALKSEFEDLMLAWEEQVHRTEKYKKRILELDPDYSSEEEDEDDGDDEDDINDNGNENDEDTEKA